MALPDLHARWPVDGPPKAGRFADWFRRAASVVIAAHGLAHATGFLLLWDLAEPANLTYAETSPSPGTLAGRLVGVGWLAAGALFVVAAIFIVRRREQQWTTLSAATLLSLAVLLQSQDGVSVGITIDLIVVLSVVKLFARGRVSTPPRAR